MKANLLLFIGIVFIAISCGCSKPGSDAGDDTRLDQPGNGSGTSGELFVKDENALRLVQYNVGVFSKFTTNSTRMVADMLNEMKADVCSINETDSCNLRHNVYQMEELDKAMGQGWDFRFGRAWYPYREGAYGNGILTKDAILKTFNIELPADDERGETRAALGIETEKYVFISTHIALSKAQEQVSVMVNAVKTMYGTSKKAVFVAGDFNMKPNHAVLAEFMKDFTMISVNQPTASSTTPTNCIDYVFAMNNGASYEVKKSVVPKKFAKGDVTVASDHLPVYVDVIIK